MGALGLPPLMDASTYNCTTKSKPVPQLANVPCFSNPMNVVQRNQEETMLDSINNNNSLYGVVSNPSSSTTTTNVIPRIPLSNSFYSAQNATVSSPNVQLFPNSVMVYNNDQSILRALLENNGSSLRQSFKTERETVMNSEVNTEISAVMANLEMGRRPFCDQAAHAAATTASAGSVDIESFWNY